MKHIEFGIQASFCDYLRKVHPNILFLSDTIGNIKLNVNQAGRNKRIQCQKFKCPDVLIFKPNEKYHGLFLEFKKVSPYLKNGGLTSNKHIQEQNKSIQELNELGYYACFVWSVDMAIEIFDKYLDNKI